MLYGRQTVFLRLVWQAAGQGDILALVKQDGTVAARYIYDTWGALRWVKDGNGSTVTSSSHIGHINPMRYRGYYYDRNLGLYYLQSRFYDAETGWFINADGYVSTGQGLLSQNMFAYCLNNPVNMQDGSGMIVVNARITNYLVQLLKFSYKCLKADIKNFDIDNEDEKKVLGASYFSAYKKVPVIKLPIGNNAFSFGAMFIGTENDKSDVNTIRHEYGHSKQFKEIGPLNYTIFVATPSLIGYWRDVPYADYYSQPWEYGADKLGGVERNGYPYAEDAEEQYRIYWDAVRFR